METVNIILLILHYSQVEIRAGGELRGEDGGDFKTDWIIIVWSLFVTFDQMHSVTHLFLLPI